MFRSPRCISGGGGGGSGSGDGISGECKEARGEGKVHLIFFSWGSLGTGRVIKIFKIKLRGTLRAPLSIPEVAPTRKC